MSTIGIIGAGQAGSVLAQALIDAGHRVVVANSRTPRSLDDLVRHLGPRASAAWAADAAAEADIAFLGFPYAPDTDLPAAELAGKIVLDNNNYMVWRDGNIAAIDTGAVTVHELRQQQLPASRIVKAFSHVQFHPRFTIRSDVDSVRRRQAPRAAPPRPSSRGARP
ncbi:NAD(P)-binding domain-containing protein [Curtobacterium sp. MCJR17_020]|uniref:NADPH-dependent F420 reductase n=1 Tax=Curtobacterium sp. MCJR17_020 TaxID=2175619 RepID=UPI0021AC4042|nr:NAD(P)-binding domain-containing protein [Curtobacterium sp. MCJR17_020]WIE74183.1 NAD(P)-binding domain-containing protein [Curtobacterium sp. MCJR17_020]